jgi:hypothetical protein
MNQQSITSTEEIQPITHNAKTTKPTNKKFNKQYTNEPTN